jgi:hypothetical protein
VSAAAADAARQDAAGRMNPVRKKAGLSMDFSASDPVYSSQLHGRVRRSSQFRCALGVLGAFFAYQCSRMECFANG